MKVLKGNKIKFEDIKDALLKNAEAQFNKLNVIDKEIKMSVDVKKLLPSSTVHPNVTISRNAWMKMSYLVQHNDKELAWHGLVERKPNGVYLIYDILVYPQLVTGATVESDDSAYPMWLMTIPDEHFNEMRMQGHSHVNMGTSPSGTDKKYMDDMLKEVDDFYIFIILNKKGSMWMELVDKQLGFIFETKDISITIESSPEEDWAITETELHIKEYKRKHNQVYMEDFKL